MNNGLPKGWQKAILGELVEIKHGWPFKSEHFCDQLSGRPIVIGVGNFRYTGGFRFESTLTKEYRAEFPREYELSPGDILVVMTCQTSGGEILGIPGRVPNDGRVYLHNQRLGKAEIKQSKVVEGGFLYWLFLWPEFNRHLYTTSSGTKILHTAPKRIESFHFLLPPFDEQRAIARILSALDDKIELNRRMNETLEQIARAIFKAWFVDFAPVRAKSEGRQPPGLDPQTAALFPDSFTDSPLGPVPKGWPFERLESVAERIAMGPFGSNIKVSTFVSNGIPVISGKHLSETLLNDSEHDFITDDHAERLGSSNVYQGDVVFTHAGNIGQVSFISTSSQYKRYVLSQRQFFMRCNPNRISPIYIVYYFKSPVGQHTLLANTSSHGGAINLKAR